MTTPNETPDRYVPFTIEVDDTDLREAMALMAKLPADPVPYWEDEAHLIEVTRQSGRMCWDRHTEGSEGERVSIGGHAWILWLDRAETAECKLQSTEPLAVFHIDRIEG